MPYIIDRTMMLKITNCLLSGVKPKLGVDVLGHFINCEPHSGVCRGCSRDAWSKALVESANASFSVQLLHSVQQVEHQLLLTSAQHLARSAAHTAAKFFPSQQHRGCQAHV